MEVKKLKQEEHILTRPLYETVFSEDGRAFVDYYYTEKTKDNCIYAGYEDGKIRSMVHLNPYTLMVNGHEEPGHYIVAVATEEAYRKRGYMAELLKETLRDMYRKGEPFTFLMPAAETIYTPHGFRTVYKQEKRFYHELEKIEGYRRAQSADASAMADAAEVFLAQNYQVYAKRDEAYYVRLMKEYESDGGHLMVREDDGQITDIVPEIPFHETEGAVRPKIMTRIVDAKKMLMLLPLNYLLGVCFHVTDPVIEENNRCFMLTGTEYSGVMLMEGKPENSEGTLTIEALTKLVFGAATAEELEDEPGVSMSGRMREELKKIVPLSRIFLNEIV